MTFLMAGNYYRIYEERLLAEEYYRNTSNALAHDLKTPLENLIGNAVKYTPEEHEIRITATGKCCVIQNTGVMIPEDKLSHVWEPFVKGKSARTGVSGTGIGLTIVKEIMDLHGFGYDIRNGDNCVSVTLSFGRNIGGK